ncbi:hypothetical protein NQ317_008930 [Molorchus minor]|uniref:Protein anon-73B1 n=1 Tax=Molorchus minor TaxID=1323400 RepID=A0ABQ9K0X4_9CUCU|nr:hypothetical protein NQ317_008930 [Molorchus minor]
MNAAINIGVEDMTATIVRYGLYLGALFQIVCLAACIFMPDSPDDNWGSRVDSDDDSSNKALHKIHRGGLIIRPENRRRKNGVKPWEFVPVYFCILIFHFYGCKRNNFF